MSQRLIQTLIDVTGLTSTGSGATILDMALQRDFVAELLVDETAAGTSIDVIIQDSFDGGVTWHTWITFAQLGVDGTEVVAATRPPGGEIRANYTIDGGTWSVRVLVSSNPLR